jgi:hypothetical protein
MRFIKKKSINRNLLNLVAENNRQASLKIKRTLLPSLRLIDACFMLGTLRFDLRRPNYYLKFYKKKKKTLVKIALLWGF